MYHDLMRGSLGSHTHESTLQTACSWVGRVVFAGLTAVTTATAPASEVEAVVRSPTNMAAAKIAAVDFSKMTSK